MSDIVKECTECLGENQTIHEVLMRGAKKDKGEWRWWCKDCKRRQGGWENGYQKGFSDGHTSAVEEARESFMSAHKRIQKAGEEIRHVYLGSLYRPVGNVVKKHE